MHFDSIAEVILDILISEPHSKEDRDNNRLASMLRERIAT